MEMNEPARAMALILPAAFDRVGVVAPLSKSSMSAAPALLLDTAEELAFLVPRFRRDMVGERKKRGFALSSGSTGVVGSEEDATEL